MKYLSIKEVSARIGLGVEAVHRMIKIGRLEAVQPGGRGSNPLVSESEQHGSQTFNRRRGRSWSSV